MTEKCGSPGCTTLALLALPKCEFCDMRFCTRHMMPEVHGCGDACKKSGAPTGHRGRERTAAGTQAHWSG
ncbi:hypothetical protein STCU_00451 [Strigomonas culicis]|uniref:AN1-type domain-containing protein n=1 Tax=Strigomonas culicis TaxID=28005 RepID=S9V6K5_9TRYP|nr:hypothetical protein STCU_00451 [Strigomonas culicis]|eukprot:EPY36699.1 hypothetical protein STCU_00451 [Strigomonas culicis]